MAGDFEPKIGDPAENLKASRNAKNLHGWPVEKWLDFVRRNPECTLPGGVASALVRYLTKEDDPHTIMVPCSTEFLNMMGEWSQTVQLRIVEMEVGHNIHVRLVKD